MLILMLFDNVEFHEKNSHSDVRCFFSGWSSWWTRKKGKTAHVDALVFEVNLRLKIQTMVKKENNFWSSYHKKGNLRMTTSSGTFCLEVNYIWRQKWLMVASFYQKHVNSSKIRTFSFKSSMILRLTQGF